MANICTKPAGSCKTCRHYQYDTDYGEKVCYKSLHEELENKEQKSKQIRDDINKLQKLSSEYNSLVTEFGNECAYTDSIIESIILTSVKLAVITNNEHLILR